MQLQNRRRTIDPNLSDPAPLPMIASSTTFDRDAIFEEDDEMTDEVDDDIEHLRPSAHLPIFPLPAIDVCC